MYWWYWDCKRQRPPSSLTHLFQITATSHCVWEKLLYMVTEKCPLTTPVLPSSLISCYSPVFCLFPFFGDGKHTTALRLGLRTKEQQISWRQRNSLIEYWSGIVRQAEMTKFTYENKAVACCAFSAVINSAGQRDVSISQELHSLVITMVSCIHVVTNLVKTHVARQRQ